MLTPDRIAELRALLEKATPGPWAWRWASGGIPTLVHPQRGLLLVMDAERYGMNKAIVRFAKRSPNDKGGIMFKATEFLPSPSERDSDYAEPTNPDMALIAALRNAAEELLQAAEAALFRALIEDACRQDFMPVGDFGCEFSRGSACPLTIGDTLLSNLRCSWRSIPPKPYSPKSKRGRPKVDAETKASEWAEHISMAIGPSGESNPADVDYVLRAIPLVELLRLAEAVRERRRHLGNGYDILASAAEDDMHRALAALDAKEDANA